MTFILSQDTGAQNAPVTTLAIAGNALPGQVDVPVTVTGFNNIGAVSLCLDYQYAGLHFVQGSPDSALAGFAIGDQDLGNGKHRITMGWFGSGISLTDGSTIMTMSFTFISGITSLEFFDNGPSCEYADASYNVLNDVPQNLYYINGLVCGNLADPGANTGSTSLCQGQTGVGYSVVPLANATGYSWTLPAGATIISGYNTNAVTVDFSSGASSGTISVKGVNACGNGPSSHLDIIVNVLPVANAGPDISIPYGTNTVLNAASGGSGTFSYHWSPEQLLVNPNLQSAQTVNLTVTNMFTLLVTNQSSLCKNTDDVVITVTGGPLNLNPVCIPGEICHGESAQLFGNAGGGSGIYTYSWTCTPPGNPPWSSNQANPVVSPDSSKTYHLTISDGFNNAQGSTQLTVDQLPTATLSGGDTLCGAGLSTTLTLHLTGEPPWSFYYSNGITTWHVTGQLTSPYLIEVTEPGIYTILVVADAHCIGTTSGSAVVAVFPVPPTPVISINSTQLNSTGCCGNQWYKEGILIEGATGQNYEPQSSAHYFDIVTIDGCSSDTSNVIYYLMTATGTQSTVGIHVEPNPASDKIRIRSINSLRPVEVVKIYSITGKPEGIYRADPMHGEKEMSIDIHRLVPGLYFLSIITRSEQTVVKLVVQ